MQFKHNCTVTFYFELLLNVPVLEESAKVEVGGGERI